MGERQDTNPNTTLNGYIMEFWKFDLTWKLKCPMQQKIRQKEQKETDRIPSTTPGAEPPRDTKDSGSARSHSTHPETSSSNRP